MIAAPVAPSLPLDRAALCLNCHVVLDIVSRSCPMCAGESLVLLTRWLGREAESPDG
jgi:hypothetical protein